MDKGEPSLVPEWLRSSGHGSGGGSSDSASLPHSNCNRNSRSNIDIDSVHSPFLERSSSINSRRGYNNGSAKHAYSSFNFSRCLRDKDRSREKDRESYVDPWDLDTSIPLKHILLTSRDHDQLRRSHSTVTKKQGDRVSRGFAVGLKNGSITSSYNGNGILPGPSIGNSFQRTGFDKDFPTLGLGDEEKYGGNDVVRVLSPGVSSAVQRLPVGNSALTGGEGWTSVLAEVPSVIEEACAGSLISPKAIVVSTGTLTGSSCLNMAEALAHAPARTQTPPQTQRHEDLAIKQSRQLIPVVPSTPKCLILNSSDKLKTKAVVRAGETGFAPARNTQQQTSVMLGTFQSNNGQIKCEKKLLVLKPARENGVAAVKESRSPIGNSNSRPASNQPMNTAQLTKSAPVRSTNSLKNVKGDTTFTIEKKSSSAQTQSRNAFYSALKQKTSSTNISHDPVNSSFVEEKVNSSKELVASDSASPQDTSSLEMTERTQSSEVSEKNTIGFEAADMPDEKEAEFLRSLGWDESNGEDEALTEEEIKAFVEQYKKRRPSLRQKLSMALEEREDVARDS